MATATIAVKPAAGPVTLSCDPLNRPTTIPPTTPAIIPENRGAPDAKAIPKQSGSATSNTTMDADRFGVSQLHQLRGRVGRGSVPGLCLFVSNAQEDSQSMQRLVAVAATLDGFELARLDLEQRKEGDVLGRSQSGGKSHLRLLRVLRDEKLIDQARQVALDVLAKNPELTELPQLKAEVEKLKVDEATGFMDKS
jgi:ATP-dependent DNA helicase RecG